MAIWPFNRKKTTTTATSVPPEVQDYYNAQHRERVGVAWLIAVASLMVCIVLVVGIFFGGRWAYRKVVNKNPGDQVAVQDDTNKDTNKDQSEDTKPADANKDTTNQDTKKPDALPSGDSGEATDSTTTPPQTSSSSTTTPQTSGKISETGPGDTLAVFAVSTVVGTVLYQAVLRRRATQ